ncbi:MAG: hypothetical protein KA035_03945 [Candidatus Levybacteria bacterium]|nr:hypothetical protein [Candidatus Levybacteria bacterium]
MKKRILVILSLIILLSGVSVYAKDNLKLFENTAYAVGELTVNWGAGISEGEPIFEVSDMIPGQIETHTVEVLNGSSNTRPVGVKGIETANNGDLSSAFSIIISQGSSVLYGAGSLTGVKTLADFFEESSNPSGIFLSNINPGDSVLYTFTIIFNADSGNEFQNTETIFDLKIGMSVPIPTECAHIKFGKNTVPILGTAGSDKINGTPGNDFIMTFEGVDTVTGGAGNDCIVGISGVKKFNGGAGNDGIIGGSSNDSLDGGAGNDIISGGAGNDTIKGGAGNDALDGGLGNDVTDGNAGKDSCSAETTKACESAI